MQSPLPIQHKHKWRMSTFFFTWLLVLCFTVGVTFSTVFWNMCSIGMVILFHLVTCLVFYCWSDIFNSFWNMCSMGMVILFHLVTCLVFYCWSDIFNSCLKYVLYRNGNFISLGGLPKIWWAKGETGRECEAYSSLQSTRQSKLAILLGFNIQDGPQNVEPFKFVFLLYFIETF